MTKDATGGRDRVIIDGVDFSSAIAGQFFINSDRQSSSGIIYCRAKLDLVPSSSCPESLDPRVNTTRWQIGKIAQISLTGETSGSTQIAALRILSKPEYDEWNGTLSIELGCELAYRDGKNPLRNVVPELDPLTGLTRVYVVDKLLKAAGISGGLTGSNPPGQFYYPPQSVAGNSYIKTAGELAFSAPGGPYFIYARPDGQIECKGWDEQTATPAFYLSASDLLDTELISAGDYARPVSVIRARGSDIHVCSVDFTNPPPIEVYAPANTIQSCGLYGDTPLLVRGEYTTRSLVGNTLTEVVTVIEARTTTGAISDSLVCTSYGTEITSRITRVKTFDSATEFILSSSILTEGITEVTGGAFTRTLQVQSRTTEAYEYDSAYRPSRFYQRLDKPLNGPFTLYPGITPPVGTPTGTVPLEYQNTAGSDWVPWGAVEKTWAKKSCSDDSWELTTRVSTASTTSRYTLIPGVPDVVLGSAPPEPERQPLPYATSEVGIIGQSTTQPIGATYDTYRDESVSFADADDPLVLSTIDPDNDPTTIEVLYKSATCDHLAEWLQQQTYGYGGGNGRNFKTAVLDRLISAYTNCPFGQFTYTDKTGAVWQYGYSGLTFGLTQTESAIEWDAPLIGSVPTATPTISGNVVTAPGIVTTPDQPVVFTGTANTGGVLVPGTTYYATPNGSGGFTLASTIGGAVITLTNTTVNGLVSAVWNPQPPYSTIPQFESIVGASGTFTPGNTYTYYNAYFSVGAGGSFSQGATFYGVVGSGSSFVPGSAKAITGFTPSFANVGDTIKIFGNLTGATAVRINGTAVTSFTISVGGTITAIVGTGTTTGLIAVDIPGSGTVYSADPLVVSTPLLTVQEVDGAPSVSGVKRIIVPNSSLTDNGNGEVEITFVGGGSGDTVATTSFIGYWALTESSGNATDSIGSNTLTDNGTVGSISNATATNTWNGAYARTFNGSTQWLSVASNSNLQAGDINFTVFAAVYPTTLSNYYALVAKDGSSSGEREYALFYDSVANRFAFSVFKATDSVVQINADFFGAPTANAWYFIAAWHDATNDQIFIQVNGSRVNKLATGGALQAASAGEFRIGHSPKFAALSLPSFPGRINAVGYAKRIINRAERETLWGDGVGKAYPW